jgi:hypothetical protein
MESYTQTIREMVRLSYLQRQVSRFLTGIWTPACAGVTNTAKMAVAQLD